MSTRTDAIVEAALQLHPAELDEVLTRLSDRWADDLELSPECEAEVLRRLQEANEHPERMIPGDVFLAELRARIAGVPNPSAAK